MHTFRRLAAAAALLCAAAAAQATEFRSSDIHPDDYPTVLAVRHMGETLSKMTNGKHSIKVFAKSALGQEKDTIEQTKLGALAMTRVNVAPMNNICPATMVPTMPFLFRDTAHMRKVLDGAVHLGVKGARGVLPQVVSLAEEAGVDVYDLTVTEPTLETVFIDLTGKDLRE